VAAMAKSSTGEAMWDVPTPQVQARKRSTLKWLLSF
jgi:hypothetical protein